MTWIVSGSSSLPIVEDENWDGDAARRDMVAAGADIARRGHLLVDDAEDGSAAAHYRLPFARLVGGELKASTAGLRAAASYLPQTDAPQATLDKARKIIDAYYEKMKTRAVAGFQARAQLFSTEGHEHSGMMIALYPSPAVAQQLANIPGVETPADQMHITLLYIGNVQEMTDEQVATVIAVTGHAAAMNGPFEAKINGIGRFNGSKGSDGKDVIYAVVDGHELDKLRSRIAGQLEAWGVALRTDHGFNPHVTLAYIEPGAESPVSSVPTIDLQFDHLSLAMGDRIAHYPLGAVQEEEQEMSTRNHRSILGALQAAYENLRTLFANPVVNRDISLNGVAMQCVSWFESHNAEMGDDWDAYHFLQEIYQTEEGGLYVISVSGGKLFKWAVTVNHSTGDVALGDPVQVTQVFTSSSEARTINVRKREDGRYEAFAVLSTAQLNKDGQIDSRTLFDSFVEQFRGDGSEYINIYHIGRDKTRIGELRTIFREGNVLIGYYVLDDNIVAQRVGETLSSEEGAKWGGSIEFWTEEQPEIVRVADGIVAPVFRTGTLLGYSIALAADGAAWGTKHLMVNRMNKTNRDKISQLLGGDEEAMALVESWVDEADERTRQPGVITHTTVTDDEAAVEQVTDEEAETVEHAVDPAMDEGTGNQPAQVDIDVDEEMVNWLIERVAASEWGASVESRIGDIISRLSDAEAVIATLTESQQTIDNVQDEDEEVDAEMQVMSDRVDHVAESVALIGDRLTAIEENLQRLSNRAEAERPAAATRVTLTRPAAVAARPTEQERTVPAAVHGGKDSQVKIKVNWKPTGLFS